MYQEDRIQAFSTIALSRLIYGPSVNETKGLSFLSLGRSLFSWFCFGFLFGLPFGGNLFQQPFLLATTNLKAVREPVGKPDQIRRQKWRADR